MPRAWQEARAIVATESSTELALKGRHCPAWMPFGIVKSRESLNSALSLLSASGDQARYQLSAIDEWNRPT